MHRGHIIEGGDSPLVTTNFMLHMHADKDNLPSEEYPLGVFNRFRTIQKRLAEHDGLYHRIPRPVRVRAGLSGSGHDLRHGRPRRGNRTLGRSCRMPILDTSRPVSRDRHEATAAEARGEESRMLPNIHRDSFASCVAPELAYHGGAGGDTREHSGTKRYSEKAIWRIWPLVADTRFTSRSWVRDSPSILRSGWRSTASRR